MSKKIALLIIVSSTLVTCAITYPAAAYLKQFTFNEPDALDKWGNMLLNGRVDYILMRYGNNGYIEALSDKTCSALYYRLGFKLRDYPLLSWKWRVLKFPDISKAATEKEREDYAARIYVIFPFLTFSSSRFIEYLWAEDLPVGTIRTSPVGNNIKQIVVRSGKIEGAQWVVENRNVYEDYAAAFGKKPAMSAGAVAIMCNADNSKSSAGALFDDITIGTGSETKELTGKRGKIR